MELKSEVQGFDERKEVGSASIPPSKWVRFSVETDQLRHKQRYNGPEAAARIQALVNTSFSSLTTFYFPFEVFGFDHL